MVKRLLSLIYFIIGLISATLAYILSIVTATGLPDVLSPLSSYFTAGGGVDIAADGGALGFAILSGICFACSVYLTKGENN